jgi:SAM-dependent methyltransferase
LRGGGRLRGPGLLAINVPVALAQRSIGRLPHLGFQGNLKETRYGWLRLTPAYSVHLVRELLEGQAGPVLDPFCGTGTTALVCAERGVPCDTTDINPFLIWLAKAKTARYRAGELSLLPDQASRLARTGGRGPRWAPPLHQIEKWWDARTLAQLSALMGRLRASEDTLAAPVTDLLRLAFCRVMIETSNASFRHQSMSFKKAVSRTVAPGSIAERFAAAAGSIARSAASPVLARPRMVLADARGLTAALARDHYAAVITSPPYPNRMSYIRELRPYMYWLGHLSDGRAAGELDWQAIGGTWGCATSNVARWTPPAERPVPFAGFDRILRDIAARSPVLSRYVHKYFFDMVLHCRELFAVVRPGGVAHYVVGNSKFYDTLLPVERIFAALFRSVGFKGVEIRVVRKRSSKKELFEYVVSAVKPRRRA